MHSSSLTVVVVVRALSSRARFQRRRCTSSSALVITLCCLVILSITVLAFLSQARLNRQLSFSSAGQIRTQVLADAVRELIVEDMRLEMESGSVVTAHGTNLILFPKSAATAVPFRNVPATMTNLVRISKAGLPLWQGASYGSPTAPIRATTAVPASTASANDRYIATNRWNRPLLLGTNLPAGFPEPEWFLITRSGPLNGAEPAMSSLSSRAIAGKDTAIGRYAYAVYDVGGLLDINAAGNGLTAATNAYGGRLHRVNLGAVPGIARPADLVSWRNAASQTNAAWYNNATNTFLHVHPGDQRFVSRQDLIRYSQQHSDVVATDALQYLTTFTREKNTPSFKPAMVTSINPDIPNVTRTDGSPAMPKRFALSNLALVRYNATANASSAIYTRFGLTRSSADAPWVYNHGDAARILTLNEVAAANREPDFFEVLKAFILEGSLGKTAGNPSVSTSDTCFRTAHLDANMDLQIIRIGANLIDQYDSDSWPTSIQIDANGSPEVISGIENLPYIHRMFDSPYRPNVGTRDKLYCWYEFEMWNPHQDPLAGVADGPQVLRITASSGQVYATLATTSTTLQGPVTTYTMGSSWLQFNIQTFAEPTLLNASNATCDTPSPDGLDLRGLYVGQVALGTTAESTYSSGGALIQNFPTFELQYRTTGGQWVTYQKLANLRDTTRTGGTTFFKALNPNRGFYFRGDPRTTRFGGGKNSGTPPGQSMRGVDGSTYPFKQTEGKFTSTGPIGTNPGWTLLRTTPAPTHARLTALANNDATASTSYRDPDGVLRVADGGLRDAAENPYLPGSASARPIVLNRPFLSVGEMGCAFRDEPWKTLNLFSSNSADSGLLDAFSLDDADMAAGKFNLNTRQTKVVEAILTGEARRQTAPAGEITSAQASDFATTLTAMTSATPFINKSALVTQLSTSTISAALPAIKTEREAYMRALAEAGNTRTWNLLVDYVVQVGRYPASASSLTSFIVEGEKRYWLHIAIDRYTGEIVDQQLEVVHE